MHLVRERGATWKVGKGPHFLLDTLLHLDFFFTLIFAIFAPSLNMPGETIVCGEKN